MENSLQICDLNHKVKKKLKIKFKKSFMTFETVVQQSRVAPSPVLVG